MIIPIMRISYLTTILCALAGLYVQDPTWIITAAFGIIVLYMPYHYTKDSKSTYCKRILLPLPFLEIAFVILALAFRENIMMFEEFWWISMLIQAIVLMIFGYSVMILMNNHTQNKISRRWMLVYSVLVACTAAAFYAYIVAAVMMIDGYPISVESGHTPIIYNWYLMTQLTVTFFTTLAYAVILRFALKETSIDTLLSYKGCAKDE